MSFQRTLRNSVGFHGIGLHSGRPVNLLVTPAPPDSGILFVRTDVSPPVPIRASIGNVVNTRFSTTIGTAGYAVASIEHFLASCHGLNIDNAIVEIDGQELPILDGSSLPFTTALLAAGTVEQPAPRRCIVITRPVSVTEGRCTIAVYPAPNLMVTCTTVFRHPALASQSRHYNSGEEDFLEEYVPARTFGFLAEVEQLKQHGLVRGGSLANAVIIGNQGVLNREGLRFPDEPVRHKILDLTGDLRLAGHTIIGHVRAFRSGHYLNCRLVARIIAEPGCRRYEELDSCLPHRSSPVPGYSGRRTGTR